MPSGLGYHDSVVIRRSISSTIALVGIVLFLVPISQAQINASHGASGAPSAHFSSTPPTGPVFPRTDPVAPPTGGVHNMPHHGNGNPPHHMANGTAYYPYIYPVPVPYAVDTSATDDSPEEASATDQDPGVADPSVADSRGRDSYIAANDPAQDATEATVDLTPDPPQPATTLIFKDGHQIEVTNYAIVSETLYDLTPGHQRKVAMADLDLPATEKQNDDRGVVFQLPASAQAN
jgi:hypothetical protein